MCANIFSVFCALEGKMGIGESARVDLDAMDKNSPPPFADRNKPSLGAVAVLQCSVYETSGPGVCRCTCQY